MSTPKQVANKMGYICIDYTIRVLCSPDGQTELTDDLMKRVTDVIWEAASQALEREYQPGGKLTEVMHARSGLINAAFPSDKAIAARAKRIAENKAAKEAQPAGAVQP